MTMQEMHALFGGLPVMLPCLGGEPPADRKECDKLVTRLRAGANHLDKILHFNLRGPFIKRGDTSDEEYILIKPSDLP